jgi:hypothetical protein
MGASVFFSTANGSSAKEAFRVACDEAAYEYGHGGYTGTIAEKNEYVMCSGETFPNYQVAHEFASKLVDDDDDRISDKWGPAGCVKYTSGNRTSFLFFGWASD